MRLAAKFSQMLAGALLLVGVVLTVYGLIIKAEAEALLRDFTALTVGTSTESDLTRLKQRHIRFFISHTCSEGFCQTMFEVQNRWLSALRLEPHAEFDAWATVKDGVIISVHAWLYRSMPIFPTFPASAGAVDEYAEYPKPFSSSYGSSYDFPTPIGKPYLNVVLDSHATSIQRQRAFQFSFRCLVKPGWGCNLPCDYLPLAWQDWKASLMNSGWPKDNFDSHYPKNDRCKP
jgi:hypothetical protein